MHLPPLCTVQAPVAAIIFATSLLTGAAYAQTARDLSVEQNQALQILPVKPASLSVLTLLDRADATYAIGETIRLAVKSNEDAYVTVFNIGASGRVTQLFPNSFQLDNRVKANETVEIPSTASGSQIKVTGPVGGELVKVIATSKPVKIIPDAQFQTGAGIFRSVEGGVAVLNRDLAVVANQEPKDLKVAVINQVIKTISARPVPAPQAATLVPAAAGVVANAAPEGEQGFPLILSLGKPTYKVGEAMTIVAIPSEACYLTVFSTDQAGRVRMIMPSAFIKDNKLAAGQAQIVSGVGSPQSAYPLGAGVETITAVCAREQKAMAFEVKSPEVVLTIEEKGTMERDLAIVSNKPSTPNVGFAQVSVTVNQ